jgi:SAM-dependent methyltransferase
VEYSRQSTVFENQGADPVFWQELPNVASALNLRATDDEDTKWLEHLHQEFDPFNHALVMGCGNGTLKRDLLEKGVIQSVGRRSRLFRTTDRAGKASGKELDLPLDYQLIDSASGIPPEGDFDLILNHVLLSRAAYLDRLARQLCDRLGPGGILASLEYIGPHRYQFSSAQWEAAQDINNRLPEEIRQDMHYPDLGAIVQSDPSLAVHSELIMQVIARYFHLEHLRFLGGGVAYPLLTQNSRLHSQPLYKISDWVDMVMDVDAYFTSTDPKNSLLAYFVARPDRNRTTDPGQLANWTAEEDEREARAEARNWTYYPDTADALRERQLREKEAKPTQSATISYPLAAISGWVLVDEVVSRARTKINASIREMHKRRRIGR